MGFKPKWPHFGCARRTFTIVPKGTTGVKSLGQPNRPTNIWDEKQPTQPPPMMERIKFGVRRPHSWAFGLRARSAQDARESVVIGRVSPLEFDKDTEAKICQDNEETFFYMDLRPGRIMVLRGVISSSSLRCSMFGFVFSFKAPGWQDHTVKQVLRMRAVRDQAVPEPELHNLKV